MDRSSDRNWITVKLETAVKYSRPEIQFLIDGRDIRRRSSNITLVHPQSDAREVQPMRVLTKPIEEFHLPFGTCVIADLTPVRIILR